MFSSSCRLVLSLLFVSLISVIIITLKKIILIKLSLTAYLVIFLAFINSVWAGVYHRMEGEFLVITHLGHVPYRFRADGQNHLFFLSDGNITVIYKAEH